ncbi:MAG: hypothetical protein DCC55_18425 [Chloroflexi bacterium]|nr:MAG: hypothetical protein DCC55_18425 [Chloroflexota bacterium]
MKTDAALDWQILEDREWEDAIAGGLLADAHADGQAAPADGGAKDHRQLRLVALVTVALILTLSGTMYPSWRAAGADGSRLPTMSPAHAEGNAPPPLIDEEVWGVRFTIVTRHFRFEVYQRDSATFTELAAGIDERYLTLRRTLGLVAPAASLTVVVALHPLAMGWRQVDDQMVIVSPAFLPAEDAGSAAATLTHLLLKPLTHIALAEALNETPVRRQWHPMVDGLRLWLQNCHAVLPQRPCPLLHSPVGNTVAILALYDIDDLLVADPDWFYSTRRAVQVQSAVSVIAYVAHVYGAERLPSLLHAFGQHNSWQTLAPEVFGLSAQEFEQGWQQYLNRAAGVVLTGLPAEE